MISREMQSVSLLTYPTMVDQYGQFKKTTPTSSTIEMAVHEYSQSNTDDPRFVDTEYIGLTKSAVTEDNDILIGQRKFQVLHVMHSKRFNQVFLKEYR